MKVFEVTLLTGGWFNCKTVIWWHFWKIFYFKRLISSECFIILKEGLQNFTFRQYQLHREFSSGKIHEYTIHRVKSFTLWENNRTVHCPYMVADDTFFKRKQATMRARQGIFDKQKKRHLLSSFVWKKKKFLLEVLPWV